MMGKAMKIYTRYLELRIIGGEVTCSGKLRKSNMFNGHNNLGGQEDDLGDPADGGHDEYEDNAPFSA